MARISPTTKTHTARLNTCSCWVILHHSLLNQSWKKRKKEKVNKDNVMVHWRLVYQRIVTGINWLKYKNNYNPTDKTSFMVDRGKTLSFKITVIHNFDLNKVLSMKNTETVFFFEQYSTLGWCFVKLCCLDFKANTNTLNKRIPSVQSAGKIILVLYQIQNITFFLLLIEHQHVFFLIWNTLLLF